MTARQKIVNVRLRSAELDALIAAIGVATAAGLTDSELPGWEHHLVVIRRLRSKLIDARDPLSQIT